jgi:hypothetical protein
MNKVVNLAMLYIADSKIPKAGRGVFAGADMQKGSVIELCPVIELPNEATLLKKSKLYDYYFLWIDDKKSAAIALGYGSLYNHSYEPNATYEKNKQNKRVIFRAIKDIKKDEEITVNYNYGKPDDKSQLWIKSITPPKE